MPCGYDRPAFLASWSAAMAAMMLPSELPLLRLDYATARSRLRLAALGLGYLGVWLALAGPVWVADRVAGGRILGDARSRAHRRRFSPPRRSTS